jgi:hypothetical protein
MQVTADMNAFMGLPNWAANPPAAHTMRLLEQACKDQRKRVQRAQFQRNMTAAAVGAAIN